jgi:hypothetical protein
MLVKFAGSNGPIRKPDVGAAIKYERGPVAWTCGSYRDPPDPGACLPLLWPTAQDLLARL